MADFSINDLFIELCGEELRNCKKLTRKEKDCKTMAENCSNAVTKIIFNPPATIVFWADSTKTVVKAHNELFDPEKGLTMAIAKHLWDGDGSYHKFMDTICYGEPLKAWEKYGVEVELQEGDPKYWLDLCNSFIEKDDPEYHIQEAMDFMEDNSL